MLESILKSLPREQVINLLIVGAKTVKQMDLDTDTNRDEMFFDFLIAMLEGLK